MCQRRWYFCIAVETPKSKQIDDLLVENDPNDILSNSDLTKVRAKRQVALGPSVGIQRLLRLRDGGDGMLFVDVSHCIIGDCIIGDCMIDCIHCIIDLSNNFIFRKKRRNAQSSNPPFRHVGAKNRGGGELVQQG